MRTNTPTQVKTYNIPQFCAAYNISRSKLYEMIKNGTGPKIMKVGRRTLISATAAEDWCNQLEKNSNF